MDYLEELNKIKEWIKNLIIIQYRQSKKNRALIDFLVELIFSNNLVLKIRDLCLNVEKSEGAQLDVVGKWVGVDRFYNGVELWEHPYVSFINYTDIQNVNFPNNLDPMQGGFSTYTNFADNNGGFLTYKNWQDTRTAVNKLGDDIFRQLIKLKIIKNSINHTMGNIDKAITEWAGTYCYSATPVQIGTTLYSDKKYMNKYGIVDDLTSNNITVKDIDTNEIKYSNYFKGVLITEKDENGNDISYYKYALTPVYITWDVMKVIYHYDVSYKNIITVATFKDILPHPTGCEIATQQIV